jgi:hypothetical protein
MTEVMAKSRSQPFSGLTAPPPATLEDEPLTSFCLDARVGNHCASMTSTFGCFNCESHRRSTELWPDVPASRDKDQKVTAVMSVVTASTSETHRSDWEPFSFCGVRPRRRTSHVLREGLVLAKDGWTPL